MLLKAVHAVLASVSTFGLLFAIGTPIPLTGKAHLQDRSTLAALPSGGQTQLCVGLEKNISNNEETCPANYAYFGVDDPAGPNREASKIAVSGVCCPLPASDILTNQISYETDECPDNSVATGSKKIGENYALRCTQVNTDRYRLGVSTPSYYWGNGRAGWLGANQISWEEIPAGIRLAQGRLGNDKWDTDGCVSYPFGSLLVKKESKYCSGFHFRELQFKGKPGDPVRGTPVKMFPDCDDVTHTDGDIRAECLKHF